MSLSRIQVSLFYFMSRFEAFLRLAHYYFSISPGMLNHVVKLTFPFYQLPWRSLLDYPASLHDHHLVVVSYCIQSMGYSDDGCICELLLDNILNEGVSSHVHVGSSLVKH